MDNFHFSFGLLMAFEHIVHHGFRRVEFLGTVGGIIMFDLLFDQRDDLLVFDLPADAGWSKLCAFLDQEVPDEPFPHANKASLSRKLKNWFKKI